MADVAGWPELPRHGHVTPVAGKVMPRTGARIYDCPGATRMPATPSIGRPALRTRPHPQRTPAPLGTAQAQSGMTTRRTFVSTLAVARFPSKPGHFEMGLGGFNWSSQHLDLEVLRYGCREMPAGDSCDARPDVVAGPAVGCAARGSGAVLGGDRSRRVERGRGGCGWRVAGGRLEMVPARWRDAADHAGSAVGEVPVVRRARGDLDSARAAARGARDRSPGGSFAIDDLARAAPQPKRRSAEPTDGLAWEGDRLLWSQHRMSQDLHFP
jgi:hypothetical protein